MTPALLRSLVLIFALVIPAFAQQAAKATLTGTVIDPAGAVIQRAKVIATEQGSGIRRETSKHD